MPLQPAVDFGTGINCNTDLPLKFTFASGYLNLANNLLRRLTTPRGSLPWDLNCGYDVKLLLRDDMGPAGLAAVKSSIESECEKDPRVLVAVATLTFIAAASSLAIALQITTATGSFSFVVAISKLTVSMLEAPSLT